MTRSSRRFSWPEVVVHASFAALTFVAIGSAAVLWYDPLAQLVGRRELAANVHIFAGLLLPVPLAVGMLWPSVRRDAQRLERFSESDRVWLLASDRRSGRIPVDRFNAGQKLNAAFTVGAILVLFGTGLIMGSLLWSWPTRYRTGATWVHDWAAFGIALAVVGHLYFVLRYRRGDAATRPSNARTAGLR